jgi:multiple sugar transport system ATP-binding protein
VASVSIRNVRKTFDDVEVLHGVSIDIADGELVTLVGPSGCGKSTLLKIVAGIEEVTEGEIAIGGRVINDIAPKDRGVAMVFQSYALYPHMSAAQNIGFSLRMKRWPAAQIRARVEEVASVLGLTGLLDRLPRQLSGGQRQRVAIGRAMVKEPDVFLFDEPLSNLDAALRVQMRSEIKQLHRRLGTTTIFVTHDQVEAMTMSDRIVVMNGGVVEQEGSPLELYDRPRNRFVAGFIGSPAMNFFAGRIRVAGTAHFVSDGGITFPLHKAPANSDGRPVICGIRPEHFELGRGNVDADILEIEPTGSETQVLARVGAHDVVGVFRERIDASPGERIRFATYSSRVHVFDMETGRRLA